MGKQLDFLTKASEAVSSAVAAVDEVAQGLPYGKDLEVLERIQADLAGAQADLVQFIKNYIAAADGPNWNARRIPG